MLPNFAKAIERKTGKRVTRARVATFETVTGKQTAYLVFTADNKAYRVWVDGIKAVGSAQTIHCFDTWIKSAGTANSYWYGDSYDTVFVG